MNTGLSASTHRFSSRWLRLGVAGCAVSLVALDAAAYIGPGAGLSAIGSLIALIGAVFLAVVGFVWYPLKRLFRRKKPAVTVEAAAEASVESSSLPHDSPDGSSGGSRDAGPNKGDP